MKNKIVSIALMASSLFTLTGCLDMDPVSSITDKNMWQSEGQFTSFIYGVHTRMRENSFNMFILGELRSDIYNPTTGWTGESNKVEEITGNILSPDRPGLSNYAGLYSNLNQMNLFISKAQNTDLLKEKDKAYYLGQMYGMRAFYYFHLLRSWGSVVWTDVPSMSFEIGKLDKPVTPADEVMGKIKEDIRLSEEQFAADYSFRESRSFWSKAATLMLKAEVYLWSSRQMGGGISDATTAVNALTDIQNHISRADLDLMPNFADVFSYDHKGNKEIIFSIHNKQNETSLFQGKWRDNLVPQRATLSSYYDRATGEKFQINFNGNLYYPVRNEDYDHFEDTDTRKYATLKAAYRLSEDAYSYVGCFPYKYQGTTPAGASERLFADDFPVYRYADLLLLLAEAKTLTGGDPANEINLIRERAYADNYSVETMGYPNMQGDKDGIDEVLLRERYREFMFEGKRWYDLRRFGDQYVFKYTTADPDYPKRLLWPIDRTTLTNNPALHQTDGY